MRADTPQVDGDSRFYKRLTPLFVKTALAAYTYGYLPAIQVDANAAADLTTFDKGQEFRLIIHALQDQDCDVNLTTSLHNIRIERPWGDVNVKVTRPHLRAVEAMEEKGIYDPDDIHDQYALRVVIFR